MDKRDFKFDEPTPEEKSINHAIYLRHMRMNPNNFSFWFPAVVCLRDNGIYIPKSLIFDIPDDVYIAFFRERDNDYARINLWLYDIMQRDDVKQYFGGKDIFVKNGCFSNKFEFGNSCHFLPDDTVKTMTDKVSNLMYLSIMLETKGYFELVFREWIEPKPDTPTIYGGMPLRPEIRLFYDFKNKKPLYSVNYWDWDYCHEAIGRNPEDYEVYEKAYPELDKLLTEHWAKYRQKVFDALADCDLHVGIWSVDFILEEERIILIDMALGKDSAYWDEERIKTTDKLFSGYGILD